MDIRDKVALITGGGGGIGEATAEELVRRGAKHVALVDRSDRVHEVAERINREAKRSVAVPLVGDVTSADFRRETFARIQKDCGLVQICVPAAGITRDALAVKFNKETGQQEIYPQATFELVLQINLLAPAYWALETIAQVAAARKQSGKGRWEPAEEIQGTIVFIGSVSSQGNRGQIAYAASKVGLEGVASTLSKEAIFHGVRCAVIHPGFTDTPMVRAMGEEMIAKQVLPFTQLRRLIRPAEIADAICFLISNSAVSGELWADAGWHPQA